jgi:UDPglucose 6-dehydrogenase
MIITIIGNGFVGKATGILECEQNHIWYYDIQPHLCSPPNLTLQQINDKSDIIFISVPTPMKMDGTCNTDIIENLLSNLHHPFIIIRSTVPIGFSEKNDCFFMPEFLTEKNWKDDFLKNVLWIFGIPLSIVNERKYQFQHYMTQMINNAFQCQKINSNKILFCSNSEAECIKLIRNNFLANKVSFFNEIYDLCSTLSLNYDIIQYGVSQDSRIGISHTFINPDERGYGGTCFPKDTNHLYHLFQENGIHSYLIESNLYRNEYIDRKQKDWLQNYHRSMTYSSKKIHFIISMKWYSIIDEFILDFKNDSLYFYSGKESKPNVNSVSIDLNYKLFIPKVDFLFYLNPSNISLELQMKYLLNVLDYIRINETPTIFYFEHSSSNCTLMEMILEKKYNNVQTIMLEMFY